MSDEKVFEFETPNYKSILRLRFIADERGSGIESFNRETGTWEGFELISSVWVQRGMPRLLASHDALQARVVELQSTVDRQRGACVSAAVLDCRCAEHDVTVGDYECPVCATARIATLESQLAAKTAECVKAVDSIWECRTFLRGCMNHAFSETPIVEVAKDVSEEFHRNRYQLQCMAKERDNIAKERDAANLLLKRLMCVVVPDKAVPNDMKKFVRDSAATVLKDLWDYLKTDANLKRAEHDAR